MKTTSSQFIVAHIIQIYTKVPQAICPMFYH